MRGEFLQRRVQKGLLRGLAGIGKDTARADFDDPLEQNKEKSREGTKKTSRMKIGRGRNRNTINLENEQSVKVKKRSEHNQRQRTEKTGGESSWTGPFFQK